MQIKYTDEQLSKSYLSIVNYSELHLENQSKYPKQLWVKRYVVKTRTQGQ